MSMVQACLRFPKWRDPAVEAQWQEQSCFEEGQAEDWDTAMEAELAPELEAFRILADADDAFDTHWIDWLFFVCEAGILLPVEQSCYEGVLLPTEQRAMRLATCPENMLRPLRRFFEECPRHVKHLLCHYIYWLVRLERARRLGCAEWRPHIASTSE